MRTLFPFLTICLVVLGISACTGDRPVTSVTDPTSTASNKVAGNMPGMNHGTMDMASARPFDAIFIDSMIEHH